MTAQLLRFASPLSPAEQARDEYDRARSYLRHVWETGVVGDPDDERRLEAAHARVEQAIRDCHRAEGWPGMRGSNA